MKKLFILFTLLLQLLSPIYPQQAATVITPSLKYGKPSKEELLFRNTNLNMEVELNTAYTNVEGFIRMVDTAFIYFRKSGGGHLAVISSIAGTKGLGVAPAYSATKRFQNTYIDALEQLSYLQKLNIHFTDIRPGFVATDLLNDGKHYPLLMDAAKVGRHIAWSLERKQRIVVIDWRYRILVFFWKMIPRWMWKRLPVKTN